MGLNPSKNDLLNNSKFISQNSKLFLNKHFENNSTCNINNVEFKWIYEGNEVLITGSFNNWKEKIKLNKHDDGFKCILKLTKGIYYYKFIVDGEWKFSPDEPHSPDDNGNINNFIEVTDLDLPKFETKNKYDIDDKINKEDGNILKELNFNKGPPELPYYFSNLQCLNKNDIQEDMLNKKEYNESINIFEVWNRGLHTPNNTDVNNLGSNKKNYKNTKESINSVSTTIRFNNKYSTIKFYYK